MSSDHRLAELLALGDFDWIIEDPADEMRILADTHAAYADEIEAMRARDAGSFEPARVSYTIGADGETLFIRTDLRSAVRQRQDNLARWMLENSQALEGGLAAVREVFPEVTAEEALAAAQQAKAVSDERARGRLAPH